MMISELIERCGTDSKNKGWHEDRPESGKELLNWQGNKMMLMVSELVEAHDELRNGQSVNTTYYLDRSEEIPPKPEGVPSELADTVIRIMDFCFTEGIDLESIINEKLNYNKTRAHRHGNKLM